MWVRHPQDPLDAIVKFGGGWFEDLQIIKMDLLAPSHIVCGGIQLQRDEIETAK